MNYEVRIMPSAKADIFEIHAWLLEEHADLADGLLWDCADAFTSLRKFPNRCKVSEESAAFDVEVRELLFGKRRAVFRILFSVLDREVAVLRVRSTRQQRFIDQIEDED